MQEKEHRFSVGDELYTFIGEELISGKMNERYSDIRIGLVSGDIFYSVYEKFCYKTKVHALTAMYESLWKLILSERPI
jgi:hypothetical protein